MELKDHNRRKNEWLEVILNYLERNCVYCGTTDNLNVHHIIPIARGGKNIMSNLEVVCKDCHYKIHLIWNKFLPLDKKPKEVNCNLCGMKVKRFQLKKKITCKNCKLKRKNQLYAIK